MVVNMPVKRDLEFISSCVPDRVLWYGGSACLFLCLNDFELFMVKYRFFDVCDSKVLTRLFRSNGRNVHVLSVVGSGVGSLKCLADMFCCKSLSWFSPDMSRFIYFKRSV